MPGSHQLKSLLPRRGQGQHGKWWGVYCTYPGGSGPTTCSLVSQTPYIPSGTFVLTTCMTLGKSLPLSGS